MGEHRITDFAIPRPQPVPSFIAHGESKCLPTINQTLIQQSVELHSECRRQSPFATGRARIATVTAHFGSPKEHYKKAFQTHLLHSLIHGTELHVMCDPVVDDLWNKPAFILSLLLKEMELPPEKRLEWILWADRDTLIMDQCRPTSSFLPPSPSRFNNYFRQVVHDGEDSNKMSVPDVNLIATNDGNGLNNGVFLLRVSNWAIDMFTDILAFRDYKPDVALPFTEQSAMEKVANEEKFKHQTQIVPQEWFNAYPRGGAKEYDERSKKGLEEIETFHIRKGDFLLHLAGDPHKDESINKWWPYINAHPSPWLDKESIQRDSTQKIAEWWRNLGF
ncbi:hypothetical protein BDV96DRAFT_492188 [Lophiotrema nucula]|uniref:Galactosyl transferase GMA12/MNN10 family-domain-containing protein n=1 Tax=Lophiotrema nucula TaxID=690887 RepID=A0A6A5ZB91_9PLEO|nr:hypothetical protein BDV96DRAFT_492188 [Lophiotrema nucula]